MFDRLKNKTILVVEDEKVIRENLASMLSVLFKEVYTAINGLDGLDQYSYHLPDIIITDLKMRKTRLLKTDVMTTTSKKQKASVKTNTHTHNNTIS